MKNTLFFLMMAIAAFGLTSCGETIPEGTTVVSGSVEGASDLQAFLDEVLLDRSKLVIAKSEIDGNGEFQLSVPEGVKPGLYLVRIGNKRLPLAFDGSEKRISVKGNLAKLNHAEITGSALSTELVSTFNQITETRMGSKELMKKVEEVNPIVATAIMNDFVRGLSAEAVAMQKNIASRLNEQYPNTEITKAFTKMAKQNEGQLAAQRAQEKIKVGEPAPDITLPSPNGKSYSLSQLKGKVVLLDFWASWCGPCRRENPNVVNNYKKYNNKGFEVFSVSLDGLDERSKKRYKSAEQVDAQMNKSKQRWLDAIKKDGLVWDYHVSELKKWDTTPAKVYGVKGIPRTFLIDREGNIAATNLRGPQLEKELLKLL